MRSPIVSLDIQDTVIQLSHDNILPGSIGTVAGWGYFRPYTSALNYSKRSNSLKKVDVRIIDNLECSRLLPNVRIHPSHICAVSAANNPENFANVRIFLTLMLKRFFKVLHELFMEKYINIIKN